MSEVLMVTKKLNCWSSLLWNWKWQWLVKLWRVARSIGKFLAAKMKYNTPTRQSKNVWWQVKLTSIKFCLLSTVEWSVFDFFRRWMSAIMLTSAHNISMTRNQALGLVLLPPPSHPSKNMSIFTRHFNGVKNGVSTSWSRHRLIFAAFVFIVDVPSPCCRFRNLMSSMVYVCHSYLRGIRHVFKLGHT